jgi:hypothetical protein
MLYFSIPLHCTDPTFGVFVSSMCNVVKYFCSYSFIGHNMFRPNWPSSGVQVIMLKDSGAHCNEGFLPPIVVGSGYLVMWVARICFSVTCDALC